MTVFAMLSLIPIYLKRKKTDLDAVRGEIVPTNKKNI